MIKPKLAKEKEILKVIRSERAKYFNDLIGNDSQETQEIELLGKYTLIRKYSDGNFSHFIFTKEGRKKYEKLMEEKKNMKNTVIQEKPKEFVDRKNGVVRFY